MNKIIFTNTTDDKHILKPVPASSMLPNWYKNTQSYRNNNKKGLTERVFTNATIKKCMPVFDAMTAGYIIPVPADVWVSIENGQQVFTWANYNLIQFHPADQVSLHPQATGNDLPKWINPWAITTPKGYSTLFVQAFHRDSVFNIMPGVVDTDDFNHPVNFPFAFKDPKWEGLIPQGTPMAQVIPFKRDAWTMLEGTELDIQKSNRDLRVISNKFFDRYKTLFRKPKEYR